MSAEGLAGGIAAIAGKAAMGRVVELGPSAAGMPGAGDVARFGAALQNAGGADSITRAGGTGPMNSLMKALDGIDVQARAVADYAKTSEASGGELTPGEIVNLTMRCQEFMFQCQLTSNIANRSADGVQQLFRQQG